MPEALLWVAFILFLVGAFYAATEKAVMMVLLFVGLASGFLYFAWQTASI